MTDTSEITRELKRPVPLVLLVAAVIGWIAVIGLLISGAGTRSELEEVELARVAVADELELQQAASGTLDALTVELAGTQAALDETTGQRDLRVIELDGLMAELDGTQATLEEETARLETVRAEIAPLDARLAEQDGLIAQAEGAAAARAEELAAVGARLEEARAQEAALRESVAALSTEAAALSAQAAQSETQVQQARDAEAGLRTELDGARGELATIAAERGTLEAAVADLDTRRTQLASDTDAAAEQRDALQQEVTDLSQRLAARSQDIAEMEARISELQRQGTAARAGEPAEEAAVTDLTPGTYAADDVTITLGADGRFTMTPARGDPMSGEFARSGDRLTLSGIGAPASGYAIRMTCRIEETEGGFRLEAPRGLPSGCAPLAGRTFAAE